MSSSASVGNWGPLTHPTSSRWDQDVTEKELRPYRVKFDGEVYSDFALLWMVCHQSRVEAEKPQDCWLEKWSKLARDRGTRTV